MKLLIGVILILAAIWCGGWFAAASWLDDRIGDTIEQQSRQGVEIVCDDRTMSGFPFTMGAACDKTRVRGPDGTSIDAGAIQTSASLLAPGEATIDLNGPLTVQNGDLTAKANWEQMEGFVDATFDGGFDLASITFERLDIESLGSLLDIGSGRASTRPQSDADKPENLETKIQLQDLTARFSNGLTLPDISLEIEAMLEDGYRKLVEQRVPVADFLTKAMRGEIIKAKLEVPDGGKLVLSGPLQLAEDGLLSGTVKIGLANPDAVMAWAQSVSPQLEQPVSLLAQSVAGMGAQSNLAGEDVKAIELNIDRGQVRLGFIKIIELPPLK